MESLCVLSPRSSCFGHSWIMQLEGGLGLLKYIENRRWLANPHKLTTTLVTLTPKMQHRCTHTWFIKPEERPWYTILVNFDPKSFTRFMKRREYFNYSYSTPGLLMSLQKSHGGGLVVNFDPGSFTGGHEHGPWRHVEYIGNHATMSAERRCWELSSTSFWHNTLMGCGRLQWSRKVGWVVQPTL